MIGHTDYCGFIAKQWEVDDGTVHELVKKMKAQMATGPRPKKDEGETDDEG